MAEGDRATIQQLCESVGRDDMAWERVMWHYESMRKEREKGNCVTVTY